MGTDFLSSKRANIDFYKQQVSLLDDFGGRFEFGFNVGKVEGLPPSSCTIVQVKLRMEIGGKRLKVPFFPEGKFLLEPQINSRRRLPEGVSIARTIVSLSDPT